MPSKMRFFFQRPPLKRMPLTMAKEIMYKENTTHKADRLVGKKARGDIKRGRRGEW